MTHEISEDVFKADMAFGLVSRPQDHLAESYQYDGLRFDMIGEWIEREDRPVIDTGEWKEYYRPAFETLRAGKRLVLRSKLENHYTSSMKNYYGQDVLGSAVVLFNRDGRVDQRMHYDSWGKETSGNLHEMDSAGYNGKRLDMMTGMYNYGFRDYLPEAQRWMTVDPIRDGTNWYAYVGNDPINFIDPLGLETTIISMPVTPIHRHLFIAVEDSDGNVTTKGLYPESKGKAVLDVITGNTQSSEVRTNDNNEKNAADLYYSGENLPLGYKVEATIEPPKGMTQEKFDQLVLNLADNYPSDERPYNATRGPNSNTFIDDVVESTGATVPDIDKAIQQNWGEEYAQKNN